MENQKSPGVFTAIYAVLMVASLGLMVMGLADGDGANWTVVGLGLVAFAVSISAFSLSSGGAGGAGSDDLLRKQVDLLITINDRMLLSDQAKRVAFRQKDRQALREAIVEDIRLEAYDEALTMVNELTEIYGQHEDAEQFRQEILEAQAKKRSSTIEEAIAKIDQICAQRQWALAQQEAARLQRVYPEFPGIQELTDRVDQARERYKGDLIREFKEAHDREDTQRAKDLLKVMDQYLTPEEAQPYMDMARDVLASAKENLGVRFKMAMQDRDWIAALNVGEQIKREFPNSTFSNEVDEVMETLKKNAQEQKDAAARESTL